MKLTHPEHGETHTDSEREARRLAQYGWRKAPEKPSRKRKPVEEPAPAQPELPLEESSNPSGE